MVINNIYVTNTTKMSLSDRFTILQSVKPILPPQRQRQMSQYELDLRNKRLLERLALKPIVEAASSIQKIPVKQRIGVINRHFSQRKENAWNFNRRNQVNPRRPLSRRINTFANKKQTRQKVRRYRFLPRSDSFNNLNRTYSSGNVFFDNKEFKRGRGRGGRSQIRSSDNKASTNINVFRGRGNRRRGLSRGQSGGPDTNESNFNNNTNRGRGGRNKKRGIDRNWFDQKKVPTKDELDQQLDQYMAGTRNQLDRELDMYMSSAMDAE